LRRIFILENVLCASTVQTRRARCEVDVIASLPPIA
jgi:hypothetical protein